MKNIFQLANGKWRFEIQENGKLTRKTFSSKAEANNYRISFLAARKFDLSYFAALSGEEIKDIKDARAALPSGKTLLQSVQKAWQFFSEQSLSDFTDKFLEIKKNKYEAGKLSHDEFKHIRGRISDFRNNFESFADLSPERLLAYLKSKGANKTISHWRGTVSELLEFCISRGAIPTNPIRALHNDELLVEETRSKEIGFISVETAKKLLALVEEKYPQFARFYALAMFAGIRVAEVPRLKDEYFLYKEKKIIFPAQIDKIKKSWTLEDLPDNLWAWLEKYKDAPIVRPSCDTRSSLGKRFALPENFARHSFATYHLSLYFDPARTSRITRNSEQMLRDHYWGALVDKKTAQAYFAIVPKK